MLEKFFKKTEKKQENDKVLIASLLVHAAKIDENYTEEERTIIKKAIMDLYQINVTEAEEVLKNAEKKEEESNQIIEFTKEIKKSSMEFRHKIIEILWKIVYSDHTTDMYESNLIRRVCGLLYVSNKDSGKIKLKVQNLK
jgi:uncharacterized tellurite resistance protein B-like protein|tara:strand:- start:1019 stop:1438 length:420 start_codon:yes stop_codon:yes gene_type:complete